MLVFMGKVAFFLSLVKDIYLLCSDDLGIYFTSIALYTTPYILNKKFPTLIIAYILPGNAYPVVEDYKGPESLMGKPLPSGFNSNYVLTDIKGIVLSQSLLFLEFESRHRADSLPY